jgi:acyl-CoA synthetase (AMP-forming)/AMP-acid ligase II
MMPEGLLIISGRQTSVLNLGREKIKPEFIEEVLSSFDEGLESVVLAVENEIGIDEARAAIASQRTIEESRLQQHCRSRLANIFVPKNRNI